MQICSKLDTCTVKCIGIRFYYYSYDQLYKSWQVSRNRVTDILMKNVHYLWLKTFCKVSARSLMSSSILCQGRGSNDVYTEVAKFPPDNFWLGRTQHQHPSHLGFPFDLFNWSCLHKTSRKSSCTYNCRSGCRDNHCV